MTPDQALAALRDMVKTRGPSSVQYRLNVKPDALRDLLSGRVTMSSHSISTLLDWIDYDARKKEQGSGD